LSHLDIPWNRYHLVSELWFQMDLREDDCLLVRRVAAGGIDKNIGGSRAGGKDRFSICRFAARGSNGVYPDPWDFKIKRQREGVQDLEAHSLKETEPECYVWDEDFGEEEHPCGMCNFIYDSLPLYDEYEDKDWYTWLAVVMIRSYRVMIRND